MSVRGCCGLDRLQLRLQRHLQSAAVDDMNLGTAVRARKACFAAGLVNMLGQQKNACWSSGAQASERRPADH
eukprot:11198113-Lingulodinium_polyedra.AAC.1